MPDSIRFVKVSKTYGTGEQSTVALEDVTVGIEEGEFVSIVGPSGCGKTTLLRLASGLYPSTSGAIFLQDKEVNGPQRGVGMVFQSPVLIPWLDVLGNIMFPVVIQGLERKTHLKRAYELTELVGIKGFERKRPYELSGGMQQRVSLCRALIADPVLLLMDEPFGALDALTREKMNLELQRIWSEKRKTVLFVTHSIQEAVFLSDRIVVMTSRPGRVAQIVTIDFPRPRSPKLFSDRRFGQYSNQVREILGMMTVQAGQVIE